MKHWLHAPMTDLAAPVTRDLLVPWGIELAARSFFERRDAPRFRATGLLSRQMLSAELGSDEVGVDRPDDRHGGLTERYGARWRSLCDAVDHAERGALDAVDLERLLWLLHKLGFNDLVCRLAGGRHWRPDVPIDRRVALTHALALYVVEFERSGRWNDTSFAHLAGMFPIGTVERADCSYQLVQMAGRHRKDAAEVGRTLARHHADCVAAGGASDPFAAGRLWSRYWRVAAFLPQYEGDFASMHAYMDRALECLSAIPVAGEEEALVVDELRWPYLESLIKAFRVSGEFDRALDVARRLAAFTPMQAMARLHLGESLADVGEDREAVAEFRQAVALGPAGTVEGLCYLGQYAAADEDHVSAWEYFDRAFLIDPSSLDVADAIGALPDVPADYKLFVRRRAEDEKARMRARAFDDRFGRPEDWGPATAHAASPAGADGPAAAA